jgi:hypothetical protein
MGGYVSFLLAAGRGGLEGFRMPFNGLPGASVLTWGRLCGEFDETGACHADSY